MKKQELKMYSKIVTIIATIIGLFVFVSLYLVLPIPRGSKVDSDYYTYYKNIRGIYYISVEHSLELINHGSWGYLKDVDESTFTVLDNQWAKDATHVWFGDKLIKNVDAKTFHINASGVAVDKDNVYIRDYSGSGSYSSYISPSNSGIDVETAEYFVYRLGSRQDEWMRDKDYVYHYDKRTDVDRNSFRIIGEDWFIDKNYVYLTVYNNKTQAWDLCRIDSLQYPIEPGYCYFRNGRKMQDLLPLWQGAEGRGGPGSACRRGQPVQGLPQRQENVGFAAVVARGGGPEGRSTARSGQPERPQRSGAIWNDGTSSVIPPEGPPTAASPRPSIRRQEPPGYSS